MYRFKLIVLTVFFLIVYNDFADPALKAYSINTTNYPRITAKFLLTDSNNKQVNLKRDDYELYENDIKQKITNISCPDIQSDIPISLIISIEVSKSMDKIDSAKQLPRIEYAKQSAIEVIKAVKNPDSEISLFICNDSVVKLSGFTTDRNSLITLINSITTGGNFNAYASIFDKNNGILEVAKKGKFRRGALSITSTYEVGNLVDLRFSTQLLMNDLELTYFVLFTNKTIPPIRGIIVPFAYFAIHTGGDFIDSIYYSAKINNDMIQRIVYPLQMLNPCEVEWISRGVCTPARRFLMLNWKYRVQASMKFYNTIDESKLPRLEFMSQDFVDFGSVPPGSNGIIKIDLTAKAGDVTLDTVTTSNPLFQIIDYGGSPPPFDILQNTKRTLTIRFSPQDSMLYFGGFNIINNGCSNVILSMKGGTVRRSTFPNSIKVVRPNGGETLVAGSKFLNIWSGVHYSDTVSLDYSVDGGNNWYQITQSATKLEYLWKVVNIESNTCLIKAWQPPTASMATLFNHLNSVNVAKWSPDARYIASGSADSSIIIWDAYDGTIKKIYKKFKNIGRITTIGWRPDSKYFAAAGEGNNFVIINMNDLDNYKFVFADQGEGIVCISWSPNSIYMLTAASEGTINLWTADKLKNIKTIFSGTENLSSVSWSPNCMELAVSNSRATNIFSVPLGDLYKSFTGQLSFFNAYIDVSSNNQTIAVGNFNKMITVQSDSGIVNLPDLPIGAVKCVAVSPDNKKIAVAATSMKIFVYDIESRKIVKTYLGHRAAVNHVSFSPDGSFLVSASADSTIKIWETGDSVIQKDISDSLWKIILPNVAVKDIDFGKVPIGNFRDTLVTDFITNTGTVPVSIDSMKFDGDNKDRFKILDGFPPYSIPKGNSRPLKVQFTPKDTGIVKAVLKVYTQNDTIYSYVSGEGIKSPIAVLNEVIDFGKVFLDSVKIKIVAAVKNLSQIPVKITSTEILGSNSSQFHILDGGGSFTIYPNSDNHFITMSFNPKKLGKIIDSLAFNFDGIGSPAIIKLIGEGAKECDSAGFIFNDFSDIAHLNILEDARASGQSVVLNECRAMNRGAVWYNRLIPVKNGFECEFKLKMSGGTNNKSFDGSSPGGDGFAFVIQAYHQFIIGNAGGGIGYEGIPNSLAIEFDTFANDSTQIENYFDKNGNHVAIQTNHSFANTAKHGSPQTLAVNKDILPLLADSNHTYNVKINYNSKDSTLYVFIDTLNYYSDPVLKLHPFKIENEIDLFSGGAAYVGITASTGYAWERHDLLSWALCPGNIRLTDVETPSQIITGNGNLSIYPNPADGITEISFNVAGNSFVNLKIVDLLGNEISNLLSDYMLSGHHFINYDISNISSGTYYCILKIGGYREIKQLIIVK